MTNLTPEQIGEFRAHVAVLQQRYGIELTDQGALDLVEEVAANGFTPQATEQAFAAIAEEVGAEDGGGYSASDVDEQGMPAMLEQDVTTQLVRLQSKLGGHRFSARELEAMQQHMAEDLARGARVDAEAALQAYDERMGHKPREQWGLDERTAHAQERMKEATRASTPEPEEFDLDTLEGRTAFAAWKLDGGDESRLEYEEAYD